MTKGSGPGGRHDNMKVYSAKEAQLVLQLVEAHAPRWTHIAKLMSEATGHERSAASIRNYYKRFTTSKAIAECDSEIRKLNRCQICNQIKRGHICRPIASAVNFATPLPVSADATSQPAARQTPSPPPAECLLALSGRCEALPALALAALEANRAPEGQGLVLVPCISLMSPLSATGLPSGAFTSSTITTPGSPALSGLHLGSLRAAHFSTAAAYFSTCRHPKVFVEADGPPELYDLEEDISSEDEQQLPPIAASEVGSPSDDAPYPYPFAPPLAVSEVAAQVAA